MEDEQLDMALKLQLVALKEHMWLSEWEGNKIG